MAVIVVMVLVLVVSFFFTKEKYEKARERENDEMKKKHCGESERINERLLESKDREIFNVGKLR